MDFQKWWDHQKQFFQSEFTDMQLNRIFDQCQHAWKAAKNIKDSSIIDVSIRYHDGYLEEFECGEVRFGSDLLWLRLRDGKNRHIPLRSVRWFSQTPESHSSN